MKLTILGASGGCGRHLVQQALDRGHTVVAVGRASSNLDHVPESATVLRGECDDVDFLTEAFADADVVLSALGLNLPGLAPWAKPEDPTFLTRAGSAIKAAAEKAGVGRVIVISAGGVGDSYTTMPAFFRGMIRMTALRTAYAELDRFEQALWSGSFETIAVRATGLSDGPKTGDAREATSLVGRAQISRADVADWMLKHLDGAIDNRAPIVTVTGAG